MLCKNPDCGIYRLTYDVEYDAEWDPDNMHCTFCGEILAKTGADFLGGGVGNLYTERRPAQLEYAETIDSQFDRPKSVTFIEGGTGVGKSAAYLAPTILELLNDRYARAMIVTSNKALQSQLMRDLPELLQALGADGEDVISYSLLKGRNNYACPKLAADVPDEYSALFEEFVENLPADKDNWPSDVDSSWWGQISADNCPQPGVCKWNCCDKGARSARLIITNYSYFGIFTRLPFLIQQFDDPRNLKVLVMDEAHQAESYIRNALKVSISPNFLRSIVGKLGDSYLDDLLESLSVELPVAVSSYLSEIAEELEKRYISANQEPKSSNRPKPKTKGKRAPTYDFDTIEIENIKEFLDQINILPQLYGDIYTLKRFLENLPLHKGSYENNPDGCIIKAKLLTQVTRLELFLRQAYAPNFEHSNVATLDPKGLNLIPINIGELIQPVMDKYFKHIVITSATLAHSGNDFSHVRASLGYGNPDERIIEKVVGSPFDLDRAVRLYVPRLPFVPGREQIFDWYDAVSEEIVALSTASNGNGFVLFSSAKDLREVEMRTRNTLMNAGIPILAQVDDIPAATLTERYLETPNSMLYGLRSFWEGIDIRGQKLSLVIIPKLPFAVPTDPIQKARCKNAGPTSFTDIMVPDMLETLRQGAGRLIRSKTDMGLVAILDSRFWTGTSQLQRHKASIHALNVDKNPIPKGYGRKISRSLNLKLIDSREYACTILKTTIALYNKQKSA
jgi:Rad3-related DNA helicase